MSVISFVFNQTWWAQMWRLVVGLRQLRGLWGLYGAFSPPHDHARLHVCLNNVDPQPERVHLACCPFQGGGRVLVLALVAGHYLVLAEAGCAQSFIHPGLNRLERFAQFLDPTKAPM